MREWDEKEKNNNYRPPGGKTGKALGFMLIGAIGLFVAYVGSYALQWAFTPPKVAP